jgi:hypothetical protein
MANLLEEPEFDETIFRTHNRCRLLGGAGACRVLDAETGSRGPATGGDA